MNFTMLPVDQRFDIWRPKQYVGLKDMNKNASCDFIAAWKGFVCGAIKISSSQQRMKDMDLRILKQHYHAGLILVGFF